MAYLIGIDLGTSSVKVALFEAQSLTLVGTAGAEYPVLHPQPGYAEQDPEAWWQAIAAALRTVTADIDPAEVHGIGIDAQMHGVVLVGDDDRPLHPAIIWADTRSKAEVAELDVLQPTLGATLPGRPAAGFAAATCLWLHRHQPALLARTKKILLPKDYLRLRLTGRICAEASDASSTWLYDVKTADWSAEVAALCGLRPEQLPELIGAAEVAGTVTKATATEIGGMANCPVVTGAADLPAQALGHGLVDPGQIFVTVGTGGQALTALASPQLDPGRRFYTFQHCIPDRWYAQAAMLAGGMSLRWLRDLVGLAADPLGYAKLSALAADISDTDQLPIFLPYLAGERSPHFDPDASGAFIGLRLHHGQGHLARAVMEGVGFALLDCIRLLEPLTVGGQERPILLSGGIAKSPIWRQLVADIWQRPLDIVVDTDVPPAALGAAMLAGVGSGVFGTVHEATQVLNWEMEHCEPRFARDYRARYAAFQSLYPLPRWP